MIDYTHTEEEIRKIIALVEKLPETYKLVAFEVLLKATIRGTRDLSAPDITPIESKPDTATQIELPIDVKAFLMQYTIPEEAIMKLFLRHGTQMRPIYKIKEEKKGTAQIQIALLTALENALKSAETKFEFSTERVRIICKDQGKYDQPNFNGNFRYNKKLFTSLTDPEHVELSAEGKSELADVVAELTK